MDNLLRFTMAPPVKKTVWMACRAGSGGKPCPGNQAEVLKLVKTPGGGHSARYKCLTCNRPFHVSV